MTFYKSIKLLGLPTTKHFLVLFQDAHRTFNFARLFRPFSLVSTQPYQNDQAKLKSCGHPRIKIKKNVLWSGNLKASLRIAAEKSIYKTSSTIHSPWTQQVILQVARLAPWAAALHDPQQVPPKFLHEIFFCDFLASFQYGKHCHN